MSSFDRAAPGFRRAACTLLILAAAAAVSACTIQPVYGPGNGSTGSVANALKTVSIDPVDDRVSQSVRNQLLFGLTGGTSDAAPVYQMHLVVTDTETALAINFAGGSPTYSVTVAVTYVVTKIGTKEVIQRNTVRASASYEAGNQAFTNTRAKIDAENRAAITAANEIKIRVATALASRA